MQNEYEKWNKVKQELAKVLGAPFEERQIWWTSIGYNLGDESYEKKHLFERPVLALRKLSAHTFVGIPFTTTESRGSYFYEYENNFIDELGEEQSRKVFLMLHQARVFSKKRLIRKLGKMADLNFEEVREKYIKLFSGETLQIERPAYADQSRIPNGKDNLSITAAQNLSSGDRVNKNFSDSHRSFKLSQQAVILNNKNEVLVLLASDINKIDHWLLPGGRVDKDEVNLENALERELQEETSLILLKQGIAIGTDISMGGSTFAVAYLCEVKDLENIKLSEEHSEYRWVNSSELEKHLFYKKIGREIYNHFNPSNLVNPGSGN